MAKRDIYVLLLDDQQMIYQALINKFRIISGARVIGHVEHREQLVDFLTGDEPYPDIVLMDIHLGKTNQNAYCATEWLAKHHPNIRVIGYSNFICLGTRQRLLDHGACAFLAKDCGAIALHDALNDVYGIGHHLNEFVSEAMLQKAADNADIHDLSQICGKLETILWLCTTDLSETQIADLVLLSEKTVRNSIAKLRSFFNVKKTKALVAQAIWQGIMPNELPAELQDKVNAILANQSNEPDD